MYPPQNCPQCGSQDVAETIRDKGKVVCRQCHFSWRLSWDFYTLMMAVEEFRNTFVRK